MSIRRINAMWMESVCPDCGHTFRWHRERRNMCPACGADYGHIMTIGEVVGLFNEWETRNDSLD